MCQQGDCKGSICLKYGMEQCFLSSKDKNVRYNTRDLCELACQVSEVKNRTKNREGTEIEGTTIYTDCWPAYETYRTEIQESKIQQALTRKDFKA